MEAPPALQACDLALDPNSPERLSWSFPGGGVHWLADEDLTRATRWWRVLGLLEPPSAGEVRVAGTIVTGMPQEALAAFRSQHFGYLFPQPYLLAAFSVLENVAMPLFKIAHATPEQARQQTGAMLQRLGLASLAHELAADLTLSQQHRVALARALIHRPDLLMFELPSGHPEDEVEFACTVALEHGATPILAADLETARRLGGRLVFPSDRFPNPNPTTPNP